MCELLGLDREIKVLTTEDALKEATEAAGDLRSIAEPKALAELTETPHRYYQVFAHRNGFIPNLSIVDLLFNMGPEGLITLKESIQHA